MDDKLVGGLRTYAVAVALSLASLSVQAVPATYVISGVGSGIIDSTPFAATAFTITVQSDTSHIFNGVATSPNGQQYSLSNITTQDISSETVQITGFAPAIIDPTHNDNFLDFGVNHTTQGIYISDLLGASFSQVPGFDSYDLSYRFGPVSSDSVDFSQFIDIAIDYQGGLYQMSLPDVQQIAFQAFIPSVPIITSSLLFASGLIPIVGIGRRRRIIG